MLQNVLQRLVRGEVQPFQEVDDARGKEADVPDFENNITEESLIKIPGSDFITIKPQGSAELKFGINISRTDNIGLNIAPIIPPFIQRG